MGGIKLSRDSVQRDHEEISGPTEVFKFKKKKGQVLPLGKDQPMHQRRLGSAQGLEILVGARLGKTQGAIPPQIGKPAAEWHEEERGQLSKGHCYLLCSEQARTPGELHPISGPQFKRDVEILEWIQEKLPQW